MRVAGREKLEVYKLHHSDVAGALDAWLREARHAQWRSRDEIVARYVGAKFETDVLVTFVLLERRYRLETKISFDAQTVFVVKIGVIADGNY